MVVHTVYTEAVFPSMFWGCFLPKTELEGRTPAPHKQEAQCDSQRLASGSAVWRTATANLINDRHLRKELLKKDSSAGSCARKESTGT